LSSSKDNDDDDIVVVDEDDVDDANDDDDDDDDDIEDKTLEGTVTKDDKTEKTGKVDDNNDGEKEEEKEDRFGCLFVCLCRKNKEPFLLDGDVNSNITNDLGVVFVVVVDDEMLMVGEKAGTGGINNSTNVATLQTQHDNKKDQPCCVIEVFASIAVAVAVAVAFAFAFAFVDFLVIVIFIFIIKWLIKN
jgi:hypothetical protein